MSATWSASVSHTDSQTLAKFQSTRRLLSRSARSLAKSSRSRHDRYRECMTTRGGQQRIPRPPSYRPGRPAPWGHLEPDTRRLSLADVRARLATLPPVAGPVPLVPGSRAAAVLLPLFEEDGETRVILTKRPDTMASHRG